MHFNSEIQMKIYIMDYPRFLFYSFLFSAPIIWQPPPSTSSQSTVLVDINRDDPEFNAVGEVRIL